MKITIIGDGAFGSFLKELLKDVFELGEDAGSVILAVPFSAYEEVAKKNEGKHLINVCSIQKPSTEVCLKYSDLVTSIHPLFGRRTPACKRYSILTHSCVTDNDTWTLIGGPEVEFFQLFKKVSTIMTEYNGARFTPESHDILMAKTHVTAVIAAKQMQVYIDRAKDIPDELIPNSFRLMREFVKTLDDMPQGTIQSIMSNRYI